jgi:hypothetical protein
MRRLLVVAAAGLPSAASPALSGVVVPALSGVVVPAPCELNVATLSQANAGGVANVTFWLVSAGKPVPSWQIEWELAPNTTLIGSSVRGAILITPGERASQRSNPAICSASFLKRSLHQLAASPPARSTRTATSSSAEA